MLAGASLPTDVLAVMRDTPRSGRKNSPKGFADQMKDFCIPTCR